MSTAEKRRKKQKLAIRDGGAMCHYCLQWVKMYDLTIDHVVPRSRGGTHALTNLRLACRHCNELKADRLPEAAA